MNIIIPLIRMELKKLFSLKNSMFFIALLLLKVVIWNMTPSVQYDFSTEVYRGYISKIAGGLSDETSAFIENEEKRFDELFSKQDEMERMYSNEEITLDEFSEFNMEYVKAQSEMPAFTEIMEKYTYFEQIGADGKNPIFFYDLDISEYLSSINIDYLFLIFLVFITTFLLAQDKDNHMYDMVVSTMNGRKRLTNARLISSLLFALVGGIISTCAEFFILIHHNGAFFLDMDLYSIEQFGSCNYDLTIFQYIIAVYGMRIFWSLVLISVVFLTYALVKNNISSIFIVFALIFIPFLFNSMIKGNVRNALIGVQLSGVSVLENSIHASLFAGIATFLIALLLLNVAFSKRIRMR